MREVVRGNRQQVNTIRKNNPSKTMRDNTDTKPRPGRKLENKKGQMDVAGTQEFVLGLHMQLTPQIPLFHQVR